MLEHTGKGKFQITNYNERLTYWVVLGTDPQGPSGGVVDGANITTNTPTAEYTLFAGKKLNDPDPKRSLYTHFYRQERTFYEYACLDQRYDPCGDCSNPSGAENGWSWSCGCMGGSSGGGAWGPCICRKQATCTGENTYPGYTKQYGEWVKIDPPETNPRSRKQALALPEMDLVLTSEDTFIHSFALGKQEDREGWTKFADAVMEFYQDNKLVDVITSGDDFHFEIHEDTFETGITLFSADLPTGRGTFHLLVADSTDNITYEQTGEWRNDDPA